MEQDYFEQEVMKVCTNLEGTVDLFLVMDEAVIIEGCLDRRLPKNLEFNKIRFTPRTSHKCRVEKRTREQVIEGELDNSRYALIADTGWWKGNSLKEITNCLVEKGYSKDKLYAIYGGGSHPLIPEKYTEFEKPLSGRVEDVLRFIKEANEKYARK